ncbi:ATP-binding protein [Candidatus Woesearchaeota archaeon]|nr:ATP-binding protein [Candidatus Woesearchaeota archaeon]
MISKDKLKQTLIEQREAILQKPLGIERTILKLIEKKSKLPHVVVLTGLRRSGKSTLLRQLMKKQYDDKDFYYVSFEDERLFNFKAEDFNIIYETLVELFGEQKTFFIDEIQNITNFESFVRRFYDMEFKFFITGSSAKLLSKEIGTKLTGRHVDVIVKPFSFEEFLVFKNFKLDKQTIFKTNTRVELKKHFANYLISGGMPEYVQYEDSEILTRVYEDIVIKDIVARYRVDNVKELKELYQYLITTVSQRFSYNSLRKFIRINSANTIKKYIDYLEETYFISQINKFDYSLKKQIINDKKIYVVDNGFIPRISLKFTKDDGWLLENAVFIELKNYGDVFYYSEKFECDFIVAENKKVKEAVQVCWNLTQTNKERELNGLLEAMNQFKLKSGLILTHDQEEEIDVDTKKIIVKPVWKWLLESTKPKSIE